MTRRSSSFAPRFRLSTLLLLVAVAAVGLWWWVIRPRQQAARQMAAGRAAISDRDRVYFDFVFDDTVKQHLVTVLGDSRLTHWGNVSWIACPDAKTIAAGGGDGTLIVWNREDGAILHGFYDIAASCYASDINRFFFTREDGNLKSWAIGEKAPKDEGLDFSKTGGGSRCSPNGRYFVGQIGDGKRGKAIWDRETGKQAFEVVGDFSATAFSPDSKTVVFVDVSTIHEYDLASGELLASISIPANKNGERAMTYGAAFARDGSRFYTSNASGVVTVYEWPTREVLYVSREALGGLETLAADANNQSVLAAGSNIRRYMEWKATGELKSTTISRDDATALYGGAFGTIIGLRGGRVVAMNGDEVARLKGGPRADATCFAFSPDGDRIALGGGDGQIVVRSTADWTRQQSWKGHDAKTRRLLWPRSDTLLSLAEDNKYVIWDPATGLERHAAFAFPSSNLRTLAFDRDKSKFSLNAVTKISIVDAATFEEIASIPIASLRARGEIQFTRDGRLIAGGNTTMIEVWSLEQNKLIASFGRSTVDEVKLALSADETIVYAIDIDTLHAFDIKSTTQLWSINVHPGSVADIARHPKLPLIATCGSDGHVTLVDAEKGKVTKRLRLGPARGDILQVAFSPNGDLLAAAMSNGSVVVLNKPWE